MARGDADSLFQAHLRTLRERADAALAATGFDGLVLAAGRPVDVPFDDQAFPFHAAPYYRWWCPHDAPDSWVCYRPGHRPVLGVHRPADFWHLAAPLPDAAWADEFDVVEVDRAEAPMAPGGTRLRWAGIGDPARLPEAVTANPDTLIHWLEYDRAAKTPYEVACLRAASASGAKAHLAALAEYRAGGSEYDVHRAFCGAARQREQDLPYNAIVAIGGHAAVLHYQHLDPVRPAEAGSLLIDAGVAWRGYASDITRTYAARPGPFADLVAAMDRVQQQLVATALPGIDYVDLHLTAHRCIAGLLREAGLVRCGVEESLETGLTSTFFPHGIGHLLGLLVHDAGGRVVDRRGTARPPPASHPYLRLTRRLEPGYVVTIEPGLYFIDSLLARAAAGPLARHIDWDRVQELRPFGGIRVEDDVLVSAEGPINLTRDAFSALPA